MLQGFISYSFKAADDTEDYNPRVSYQLKFGEQYNGVLYTNLLVDSTNRYAFNTYAPRPFTSTAVISNGLISNMPSVINVYDKPTNPNSLFISQFSNVTGVTDLTATYYDKNGSVLNTAVFDNSTFQANTIRQYRIVNSSEDTDYVLFTGAFSLRANYHCPKRTPISLVWLNPYGGYESLPFGMVSKKSIEIERKDYTRVNYQINASGEVSYLSNNVFYGGKKGYHSNVKTMMSLTSHLLNKDEYEWLADLFISPEVYMELDNENFIPVTITENNYEYRTYDNSRLTPLQFSIEYSDKYNAQNL